MANQLQINNVKDVKELVNHNLVPSKEKSPGTIKSERAELSRRITQHDKSKREYMKRISDLAEAKWEENLGDIKPALTADLQKYIDFQNALKAEEEAKLTETIDKALGKYKDLITVNRRILKDKSERYINSHVATLIEEYELQSLIDNTQEEPQIIEEKVVEEVEPVVITERLYSVTIRNLTREELALLNKSHKILKGDIVEERS